MKQLTALQQQGHRINSFRSSSSALESATDGTIRSPATVFWLVVHGFCCLISLILGFRFSRLVLFLIFSASPSPYATTIYTALQTTLPSSPTTELNSSAGSRVVVGRHGILIRPWPHPDPAEVMKAHKIIERVQLEQRSQFGAKKPRTIIAITPTYVRTFQTLHLTGVMHSLMNVPYDLVWIVVEAGGTTNETASLVSKSGLKVIHIGFHGRMPLLWEDRHKFESRMRLHALRVVREKRLDGIVMFADDSNIHSLELFDEIQGVRWIGAVPVGVLVHSEGSERRLHVNPNGSIEKDERHFPVPMLGPDCNSSNNLVGWQTFDVHPFIDRRARYIGDRAVVLPKKLEWAMFTLNSRLVWEDADKMGWVKDMEDVGKDGEDVESPLGLLTDTSMVEPLGKCGRKVLLWWLRVEARADSKFPARWIVDPPLAITVPAKRTPWPDTPPELPSSVDESTSLQEGTEHTAKSQTWRKHSPGSKQKHAAKFPDELKYSSMRQSEDN